MPEGERSGRAGASSPTSSRWAAWWPQLLALALTAIMLGPALGAGFVLTYDMVFVPDLDLGVSALGLGTALPRAVPSDAVVAVLDELVPGAWLQKLVLVGSLAGGAPGVARLCGGPAVARAVAVTFWVWNPFVVERLLLGAWPVLAAYAVLPWVLLHGAAWWRAEGSQGGSAGWLLLLLPLGSLSPSAGVMTSVALLASMLGARRLAEQGRPSVWAALAMIGAAQAPWVVSGLLHAGSVTAGTPGFGVFAPSAEGFGTPLIAALSWGGVWNTEVVPASRLDLRGSAYLLVLLTLAAIGAARAWRARGVTEPASRAVPWRVLVLCWAVGYAVVVVTTLLPGALDSAARAIPGLALLRDGSRLLGLCVPLLAVAAGLGAATIAAGVMTWARRAAQADRDRRDDRDEAAAAPRAVGAVAGLVWVLAPIALLPDAAAGAGGRLQAVGYPAAYADLAARTAADGRAGAVLVLPLSTYRAPGWNDGRPVLDPVPRLVGGDVIAGGGLVVSGVLLPGEDPRELRAASALDEPGGPSVRRAALADLGVRTVVVDGAAPGGEEALRLLGLQRQPAAGPAVLPLSPPAQAERQAPRSWVAAMAPAWAAYAGSMLLGILLVAIRPLTSHRRGVAP